MFNINKVPASLNPIRGISRRKSNTSPIKFHTPKNYYLDTSIPKATLLVNKVIKFFKSIPAAIAKGFKE